MITILMKLPAQEHPLKPQIHLPMLRTLKERIEKEEALSNPTKRGKAVEAPPQLAVSI